VGRGWRTWELQKLHEWRTIIKVLINCMATFTRDDALAALYLSPNVIIPSDYGYRSIGAGAFSLLDVLSVSIPDSVTSIREDAFHKCLRLTSVTIPDSVTSIGIRAFFHTPIRSVTIPESVTSLGHQAFDGNTIVTIKSSSTYTMPSWLVYGNLTLTGTAAINGTGNAYPNTLTGNSKRNVLNGGANKDTLTGSNGVDAFIYRSITDSRVGSRNRDVITDFRGSLGEKIDLSAIDAYTATTGNQAFVYIGSKEFTGTKGEVRFSPGVLHPNGVLQMNTGTDRIADMEIELTGVTSFSKNFLVL